MGAVRAPAFAGAILFLGEVSEGAVEAPSDRLEWSMGQAPVLATPIMNAQKIPSSHCHGAKCGIRTD